LHRLFNFLFRFIVCRIMKCPPVYCVGGQKAYMMMMMMMMMIFTRTRTIAMFYLKCKIVRSCDSFHYLMTINL